MRRRSPRRPRLKGQKSVVLGRKPGVALYPRSLHLRTAWRGQGLLVVGEKESLPGCCRRSFENPARLAFWDSQEPGYKSLIYRRCGSLLTTRNATRAAQTALQTNYETNT